jgi:hypothetical protein
VYRLAEVAARKGKEERWSVASLLLHCNKQDKAGDIDYTVPSPYRRILAAFGVLCLHIYT